MTSTGMECETLSRLWTKNSPSGSGRLKKWKPVIVGHGKIGQVFRISNPERYEARFNYFNQMYKEFYRDVRLDYPVDPERPWNLFNLDHGKYCSSSL